MGAVEAARARGAAVWPQVQTRPIDISFTLDQRSLMLLTHAVVVEGRVDPRPRREDGRRGRPAARRWSTR